MTRPGARMVFVAGSMLIAAACSNEAQQDLKEAQREFEDVQEKLGEASREMGDVTKELAKAANVSRKDLERETREIVRAVQRASKEAARPSPGQAAPPVQAQGRIRCEARACVVERALIAEIEQRPQMLLQEGLVVPVSGPPAGLRLERLRKGGLGAQLGLRDGDVLTAVNDHAVDSVEDLIALPGHAEPQEELELTLSRGGEAFRVTVRLADPEPEVPGVDQPD